MSDFKWAIQKLKEGKKVRRTCWLGDSYLRLGKNQTICWKDGTIPHIHLNQIEATDWEIYCEEHEWKILHYTANGKMKKCKNCGKIKEFKKPKEKEWSDKGIYVSKLGQTFDEGLHFPIKITKEKIQNAQRRVKEVVKLQYQSDKIDKIFKEEFGDELLK